MAIFSKTFKAQVTKESKRIKSKAQDAIWLILVAALFAYLVGYKMATDLAVRVSSN
jgi:hypothetical protein